MEPEALPLLQPPFLYDHREAPGEDLLRSGAPGEDVWKKFELLASPPGSPQPAGAVEEAAGGRLGNLSAFVLRDCMWSGLSGRLDKAPGPKAGAKAPALPPPAGAHDPGLAGGECVAPGAVFAWPGAAAAAAAGGGGAPADGKIPASSGSESPSDSEGEEIDVVTVEKRPSLGVRKPMTITIRADPLDPCMKHFHISIHQQQHNYAARSPSEGFSCEGAFEKVPQQRQRQEEDGSNDGRAVERFSSESFLLKPGSAPSSDSEDATKRKNHNYLERKRRNDLRSRFLALRDQVPGLATCSKTPKVVVLSKASQYLRSLLQDEQQMVAEKKLLKSHQLELLKRISHLQGAR
ncbi:protein L-Myc [Pogona vitticeps]